MQHEHVDILIIGAGPSGTVAAAYLQPLGKKIKIVEKSKFPRFVIGESLLPKCMEHFEEVGLLEVLEKQGYQEKHGARFIRGHRSSLFDFGQQYTDGKKWTWQVPRADFDKVLADEVERRGVPIDYETTVIDVDFQGSHSTTAVVDKEGNKRFIHADFLIDCSGWGRVLPRLLNIVKPSTMAPRKAVFAHFKDEKRESGPGGSQITFYIHRRDLWIWSIPFSNGNTSVGFVGNPSYFEIYEDLGDLEWQIRTMVSEIPGLAERFHKAELAMEPISMKAFAAASAQQFGDGFVITGNSSEFLDPVFSSGVTFATESGLLAAKLAYRQLEGEKVDWQKEYADHMEQGIDVFRTYVTSWYKGSLQDIFFYTAGEDETPENYQARYNVRRQICSVLAGYVWDDTNPYVKKHKRAIKSLSKIVNIYQE